MKVIMKEDYTVTCSLLILLSRLMLTLGKPHSFHECFLWPILLSTSWHVFGSKYISYHVIITNFTCYWMNFLEVSITHFGRVMCIVQCWFSLTMLVTLSLFGVSFSAAVAEMLVQSTVKDLYLLPALPRDKWANGCVKGLKARGGVTVNICWSEGDLHEVGIWSKDNNSVKQLHYRGSTVTLNISSGKIYTFNRQLKCVRTVSL